MTNPVARALDRNKLESKVRTFKIALYLLERGESCYEHMENIAIHLATYGAAAELDKAIEASDARVRILRGGLSACQRMIFTDFWDATQLVAVCTALDQTLDLDQTICRICLFATSQQAKT